MVTTGEFLSLGKELVEMAFPTRRVGFIARPVSFRLGCIENSLDPSAQARSRFVLVEPNRLQDLDDRICVDILDCQAPKLLSVGLQRHTPLRSVLGIA